VQGPEATWGSDEMPLCNTLAAGQPHQVGLATGHSLLPPWDIQKAATESRLISMSDLGEAGGLTGDFSPLLNSTTSNARTQNQLCLARPEIHLLLHPA